jgi:hypothetical protein
MAQKVIREFIDDIDGSEAERTFTFAVDGTNYEIDLSSQNIKEFNEAIAGFVETPERSRPAVLAAVPTRPAPATVVGPVSRLRPYASGLASRATATTTGAGSPPQSSKHSTKRTRVTAAGPALRRRASSPRSKQGGTTALLHCCIDRSATQSAPHACLAAMREASRCPVYPGSPRCVRVRLPKMSSVQVMRHVGTRGGCRPVGRVGVCGDE